MKKKNNFYALIKTIIIASLIIAIGYNILATAGNYFLADSKGIVPISVEKNNSYVFYSQVKDDLTLFPWNYYDNNINVTDYLQSEKNNSFNDYVDTVNLYDYLVYYFYRTIPTDFKNYILSNNSSLANLIDYEHIENYLKIETTNYFFYYYNKDISVSNYHYNLSFTFDYSGMLYSFQCRKIIDTDSYPDDIMSNGNTYLSQLVNNADDKNLSVLFKDIIYLTHELDNYFIDITDSSNITFNFSDLPESENNIETEKKQFIVYPEKNYDTTNNTISNEQISYQIIKLQNEYLLILSDSNVVLHFDPLLRVFNGFNLSDYN